MKYIKKLDLFVTRSFLMMLAGEFFVSLFVLPALFGAQAVFFTGPIADFGGTAVSVTVYLLTIKRILGRRTAPAVQPV